MKRRVIGVVVCLPVAHTQTECVVFNETEFISDHRTCLSEVYSSKKLRDCAQPLGQRFNDSIHALARIGRLRDASHHLCQ